MKISQRGATLLEAILVSAIMGMILAYTGEQILKKAIDTQLKRQASDILFLQDRIHEYVTSITLPVDPPVAGKNEIINPLYTGKLIDVDGFSFHLEWLKKAKCNPGAAQTVPDNVTIDYISCDYNPDSANLIYFTTVFDWVPYRNLYFPQATKMPKQSRTIYITSSNEPAAVDNTLGVITRLVDMSLEGAMPLNDEDIIVGLYEKGSYHWGLYKNKKVPLSEFLGPDLSIMTEYLKLAKTSSARLGFTIKRSLRENTYVRSDGAVPIEEGRSLCWDSLNSEAMPCIRASTDPADKERNALVVDSNFVYGDAVKKTPVKVSYHTFTNGSDVFVPYIKCPFDKDGSRDNLKLNNKFAAIPSSFSSGSEAGTDFTDPSSKLSKGTKGAGGQHSMISGLSIDWESDDAKQSWKVRSAIGIDGAYASANNNSSVLRNPKSISFIALQWCEE